MNIFSVSDVTYRYQNVLALDHISLDIEEGQRVAFLGANGSGKSTLLRLLDGLYFAESGLITFRDEPLIPHMFEHDSFAFDFRRRVGLVFQNPDVQLFNPTVFDEIAFAPLQLRWPKQEILQRVDEALERMEIQQLKHRPPHRLSGGEKKRVALASVLVLDPEVLLLDEPTAALDPRSESQVIELLSGFAGNQKTVVIATHDLAVVADIADHCFVLQRGQVAAQGAPKTILDDTALLERVNLIHGHRHRHSSGIIHSHPHKHPHEH